MSYRALSGRSGRVERTDPLTKAVTITEVITLALKAGPGELAKALETASDIALIRGRGDRDHKLVELERRGDATYSNHNCARGIRQGRCCHRWRRTNAADPELAARAAQQRTTHAHPAAESMRAFTMHTKPDYVVNWHHEVLCEQLDRFVRGDISD